MSDIDQIDHPHKKHLINLLDQWKLGQYINFDEILKDQSIIFKNVTSKELKDVILNNESELKSHYEKLLCNVDEKTKERFDKFFNYILADCKKDDEVVTYDTFVNSEIDGYLIYFILSGKSLMYDTRFSIYNIFVTSWGLFYFCNFRCIYLKK